MAAIATSMVLMAGVASAQQPIDPGGVEVGGYEAEVTIDWYEVTVPNPPLPSQQADTGFLDNITVEKNQTEPINTCRFEEAVHDTIPCERTVQADATSACESANREVWKTPLVGSALSAALNESLDRADGTMEDQVLPLAEEELGIENATWDRRSNRAVKQCEGRVQSATAAAGANRNRLTVNLEDPPPVCPFPGFVCPFPEGPPLNATVNEATQGSDVPLATRDCVFDGIRADCGNVTVPTPAGNLSVDPLAPTREVADALPGEGKVSESTNATNQSTVGVGEFSYTVPLSSLAACRSAGLPGGPNGTVPGPPADLDASAERSADDGGRLEGVQNRVGDVLSSAADALTGVSDRVQSEWQATNDLLVDAFFDLWPFHEGGQPGDTDCSVNPPPAPSPPSAGG